MKRHPLFSPALACGLVFLTQLCGCGIQRKIAADVFTPILDSSLAAAYRDDDIQTVREGIAGNLLLLRGLVESHPDEEELRIMTVQAYFSYAFGFVEETDAGHAQLLYEEGLRIGREGLEEMDWYRTAQEEKPVPAESTLSEIEVEDVPMLFWTLANWTRWISLNLDDPRAVAELARVEAYMQRVIELDGEYFFGMPYAMVGSLQGFRPRMLGGDPEAGKANIQKAFEVSGNRMLIFQVLYAQYYCRQVLDQECFTGTLNDVVDAPPDLFLEYRLWNEVAKVKATRLLEMQDELF